MSYERLCNPGRSTNATWSREGGGDPGLPPGVENKGGDLWFLPPASVLEPNRGGDTVNYNILEI
ncbi:hypothetical protein CRUP_018889 [Coryphaenoides rupestris]|nr:hypothetical protein CRUP_018889 [Coryphaenoides rupestris]